jgi:hypothetical protein
MTAISEDTPEGGPEELQWQIDGLTEMLKRANDELERERRSHRETEKSYFALQDRFETLTNRLTVGVLRKAGYTVKIEEAEFCEACGEEF